ncbi:MAG: STAS/SEC14 domain-containing protein [Ignavibacteriaceae bacterium]
MLQEIKIDAPNVVGAKISGKLNKDDINKIINSIKEKLKTQDKINVYVELETFEGISFEGLLDDFKFALPNITKFKKKAVVSDKQWVENWINFANKLFPFAEVKQFSFKEKDKALEWIKN